SPDHGALAARISTAESLCLRGTTRGLLALHELSCRCSCHLARTSNRRGYTLLCPLKRLRIQRWEIACGQPKCLSVLLHLGPVAALVGLDEQQRASVATATRD